MSNVGVSVGILTALVNPELTSAEEALLRNGWQHRASLPSEQKANIRTYSKKKNGYVASIKTAAIGEMGQAHAAIETAAFLERANPDVVILCGICGSLNQKSHPKEDVVVGKSIIWRGFNKIQDGDLFDCFRQKEFDYGRPSRDFQNWFEEYFHNILNAKRRPTFSVHFSDIFTWEYVTTGERATNKVLDMAPTAACVEMEAGGYLGAVARYAEIRKRKIPAFVVRGVSDYTLQKDKEEKTRVRASQNAMQIACEMAESFLFDDLHLLTFWAG